MKKKLQLRNAEPNDVDMLFQWANNESVRKNSFHTEKIDYKSHKQWFRNVLSDDTQMQFILTDNGIPVGQIRLTCKEDRAEIAYSIAPSKRGLGYGKAIIALAVQKVKAEYPAVKRMTAKVKPSNVASACCFECNGFCEAYQQYELDMESSDLMENADFTNVRSGGGTILFLTNNKNALPLFEWISRRCRAEIYSDRLTLAVLENMKPCIVVSYNYNYLVSGECIAFMKGGIINLHISMLPWNRGVSPNIWSFIDSTPKGVTIHMLSEGLDEGAVLFQREMYFNSKEETFASAYAKLNEAIVDLFKEHWDEIRTGGYKKFAKKQQGTGSYHTKADLKKLRERIPFEWTDNIADFLNQYQVLKGD